MRRAAIVAVSVLFLSACAEPLEFPDWTLNVPEGTPLKEYEVALLDDRNSDRIEFVEDLVIGRGAEADEAFYRARDLVVDADGRIYVLDSGNHRVQVFEADGTFLRSFGKQGQGPGEFVRPEWIALADDKLAINDPAPGRLSLWSLDGEHIEDHHHGRAFRPDLVRGSANGTLVAAFAEERQVGLPANVIANFSLAGEEISRVGEVLIRGLVSLRPGPNVSETYAEGYNDSVFRGAVRLLPRFAVARDGTVYLAAGDEYQVLALAPSGEPRWALRTTLSIPLFPIAQIDHRVRSSSRTVSRSDFVWDEILPAISSMQVDGHGHLWVYPTDSRGAFDEAGETSRREAKPADVFSSEGNLLYSGEAHTTLSWHVAFEDFIYVITADGETEEQIVIRYRLVEPF